MISKENLEDWAEYRLTVGKKTWTPLMEKMFLKRCDELHELGYDVPKLLCWTIESGLGWLTLYPRDDCKRPKQHRETTVTDISLVHVNKDMGRSAMEEMKKRARGQK